MVVGCATSLPVHLSLLRIVAQGLITATAKPTIVEAVQAQLAIQGQQRSSIPHSLMLRIDNGVRSDSDRAFEEAQLVRWWPMRNTLHVPCADDYHWLRQTLRKQGTIAQNLDPQFGITQAEIDQAADIAWQIIADEGPALRGRLWEVWEESGVIIRPADSDGSVSAWRRLLFKELDRQGLIVQGPVDKNDHCYIDARNLPSADSSRSPLHHLSPGESSRRRGLAEVARRYAFSHGPVTARDLARWAGIGIVDARRSLIDSVEISQSQDANSQLAAMELNDDEKLTRSGCVLLTRIVSSICAQTSWTCWQMAAKKRKRPSFCHHSTNCTGYKDRSCLTGPDGGLLICPSRNGMFRPIVVDRGRMIGVRPVSSGLQWLGSPSASARKRADQAIADVQRKLLV